MLHEAVKEGFFNLRTGLIHVAGGDDVFAEFAAPVTKRDRVINNAPEVASR